LGAKPDAALEFCCLRDRHHQNGHIPWGLTREQTSKPVSKLAIMFHATWQWLFPSIEGWSRNGALPAVAHFPIFCLFLTDISSGVEQACNFD
jgi:hypothetical protein